MTPAGDVAGHAPSAPTAPMRRFLAALLLTAALAACTRATTPTTGTKPEDAPVADGPDESQVYFEFQVERPVRYAAGSCSPAYPEGLRRAGMTGRVQAQYVVDRRGRTQPHTFRVLSSSHQAFSDAVREAIPCLRFSPAKLNGVPVRQLVQQPFDFDIAR